MIWGSAIAGVGILLTSMTFTLIGQYIVLAVSAALYVAAQAMDPATIQSWGLFIGNQENVGLRFGGAIGILFNLFMMVVAIIAIMVTVPSERSDKRPEVPATPSIGS
jgi:DHA2 family multidrug resistance protein-like MFS transporter